MGTNVWDWFYEGYQHPNPEVRKLPYIFHDAWDKNETDPQYCHTQLLSARAKAELLHEPWWVLFFDYWRCILLWARLDDLHAAQKLGVQMMLDSKKPVFERHPLVPRIYNQLVSIFTYIDPVGYQDRIMDLVAFIQTDVEIDEDIGYLLLANRANLYFALDQLDAAREWALKSLQRISHRAYYAASAYTKLVLYSYIIRDYSQAAEYVEEGEQAARDADRKLIVCEMLAWRALLAQIRGDHLEAGRYYELALHNRSRIGTTPTFSYHDVMCDYLELVGRDGDAIALREDQLEALKPSGLVHELCTCYLMWCRQLGRMGRLTDDHITQAMEAGNLLLKPQSYYDKMEQIKMGNYDNWWGLA
jgi:tetratricopeptide (TPR) repeat protein